jgi:adenylate kinase family enzyme
MNVKLGLSPSGKGTQSEQIAVGNIRTLKEK